MLLLVVLQLIGPFQSGHAPDFMWATVTVEMTAFFEQTPGEYGTSGKFDGVGMMYLSPEQKSLIFKGLRKISIRYLAQEPDDEYEFYQESFSLRSIIRTADGEYALEATSENAFGRTVTGKIRYSIVGSGLGRSGAVTEFRLDEHGQVMKGVMNRYALARSPEALAMLKKYDAIFFGGNYVALGFGGF